MEDTIEKKTLQENNKARLEEWYWCERDFTEYVIVTPDGRKVVFNETKPARLRYEWLTFYGEHATETKYELHPDLNHFLVTAESLLSDWKNHDFLKYKIKVVLLEAHNHSSNFNNHSYLIDADGLELVCSRDVSECTDPFQIGEPVVELAD